MSSNRGFSNYMQRKTAYRSPAPPMRLRQQQALMPELRSEENTCPPWVPGPTLKQRVRMEAAIKEFEAACRRTQEEREAAEYQALLQEYRRHHGYSSVVVYTTVTTNDVTGGSRCIGSSLTCSTLYNRP